MIATIQTRHAAEVVHEADRGGECRAEKDAAVGTAQVDEGEGGHEDAEEEPEPAQARYSTQVHPALLARLVHHAQDARQPADARRDHHDDGEGHEEAPEDVHVVEKGVQHSPYFVPKSLSPASPRPGTM